MNYDFNLTDVDFLQEELDFSSIDPVEFEKLVFLLIDEMGFSNIQWRKGGEGNSATDGGRDLEATFWSIQPAVSKEEKYWFEVKYRSGQLEKSKVQNTILNASGNNSKDKLVIITNSTISNPTRDWVNEFQKNYKVPVITIWQGHDLELLLRKNPRTLSRFLPSSLAFSGRCKVIESKFINLMLLPSGSELKELWEQRLNYLENDFLTLSSVLAEVSYGNVVDYPWGMELKEERLISVLATGMRNFYAFLFRCSSLNIEPKFLIDGLSYLTQCLLLRSGVSTTAKILFEPEFLFELEYELPDKIKINRSEFIIEAMMHDLAVHCSSKFCSKLSYLSPKDEPDYFERFLDNIDKEENKRFIILQSSKDKCQLDLVSQKDFCPLGDIDDEKNSLVDLQSKLEFCGKVVQQRLLELIKS